MKVKLFKSLWFLLAAASLVCIGIGIGGEINKTELNRPSVSFEDPGYFETSGGVTVNPPNVPSGNYHVWVYASKVEYTDQGVQIIYDAVSEPTLIIHELNYIDRIVEVEVPQIITVNYTEIKEVYTQELKYPANYGELLNLFYSIQIAPDDCDDLAEYARREAEKQGFYLGECVLSGAEYNKVFPEHPMPMNSYHALNFTWVGNDGYYIDFMVRDIKKSTEFCRD